MDAISQTGARIRAVRRLRNLTQAALGDGVGVSQQTVNRWEVGGRGASISAGHAVAVARALRCDVAWLLTGKGEAPSFEVAS